MKNDRPMSTNGLTGKPSINVIVIFGITTNPVAKNIVPIKNSNANNLGFCNFTNSIRRKSWSS